MSRENVETVRRAVDAWDADDLDGFLAELDPDVEWQPAIEPGLEGKATTYRGHDGARQIWMQDRGEAWKRLTKIVRIRDFLTHAEALEAAGLPE